MNELLNALAALRAGYLIYRTAHWQTSGIGYYGNHLLLQRLYEGTEGLVDNFGERVVGVFGADRVGLSDQYQRMFPFINEWSQDTHPIRRSLRTARGMSNQLRLAYDALKSEGKMTLGIDDLIMSAANDVEGQIYLLQQATEKNDR